MKESLYLPPRIRPRQGALVVGAALVVAGAAMLALFAWLAVALLGRDLTGQATLAAFAGALVGGSVIGVVLPDLLLERQRAHGHLPLVTVAHTPSGVTIATPTGRRGASSALFAPGEQVRVRIMKYLKWDGSHAGALWWVTSDTDAIVIHTLSRPDEALLAEFVRVLNSAGLVAELRNPLYGQAMS